MGTDGVGVGTDESSGVDQGRVGFGLGLPLAVVGVGVLGIGVGRVDMGGSDGSDGGVGDHSDVVGAAVLDRLGNMGSGGDLANGPGFSLSLPLAIVDTSMGVGVGSSIGDRGDGSHLGVGEPSNLHSTMVGGVKVAGFP